MVGSEGKNVGPSLTEIGNKLTREAMYVSILAPSAGISHNYEAYTARTEDGEVITGLLVSKTAQGVVIKDAKGIERTIAASELAEIQKQEKSLMPENLQELINEQELVDVVEYADPVTARGFVFMDTPGYDPVSATGQVAGGANLICFTTGRGSVYGCKPSPSIKLATNTPLYERMTDDMDINCGEIVDGTVSVQEKGRQIFELILKVASGEATRSEALGMGNDEFVPWQLGAVM